MDKFPLLLEGRPAGELTAEYEPLYTLLTARCPLPDGLWCAWAIGEQGVLRLGVLEPQNGCGFIRRRFSHRLAAPLGRILRGEVRPNGAVPESQRPEEPSDWSPVPAPERLFRTPWLRQRLQGRQGVLTSPAVPDPLRKNSRTSGTAPGSGQQSVLSSGQQSVPGSGRQNVPGSGQQSILSSGQQFVSGSGQQSVPGSGQQSVPGSGQQSVPGSGQQSVSGADRQTNPGRNSRNREGFRIALPWDPGQPFPLPPLFCFGKLRSIGKNLYLVFSFDGKEWPLF